MIAHVALNDAKAILFDLDDTLYDAASFEAQADRAVAEAFSLRAGCGADEALAHGFESRIAGWSGYLDRWARAMKLDGDAVAEALELRRSLEPHLELRPEAEELLTALTKSGAVLAIVTNGDRRQQQNKVAALDLVDRWRAHVEYAADSEPKPSPRAVELALEALGIANNEAVFIGDASSDEAAARSAQVRFIWAQEIFGPLRSGPLSP